MRRNRAEIVHTRVCFVGHWPKCHCRNKAVEGATGHHLWAERFDRHSEALFEVQDEIVQTIVTMLSIKVDAAERAREVR